MPFAPSAKFLMLTSLVQFGQRATLALHVRRVGWNKLNDAQEELLLRCAEQLHAQLLARNQSDAAAAVVDSERAVRWFVATDSAETRRVVQLRYGDRIV